MALTLQVNGEASVWVNGQNLGISVDGIDIDVKLHCVDVMVDTYGPSTPWDTQYFLEEATIKAQLIVYDPAVLTTIQARGIGLSTAGIMANAGIPLVAASYTFPVIIKSTPSGSGVFGNAPCHKFANCYTVDSYTLKVGTKATIANVTFRALPTQQLSSSVGAVLWNTACS